MRRRHGLGNRRGTHFNGVMPAPGVSDPLDWDEAAHAVADAYFAHELHPLTRSTAGQRGCPGRGDRPGADRAPRLGCSGDGGYYASRRLRREHSGLGSPGVADRTSRTSGDAGLRGDLPSGHPHLLRRWSASLSVVGVRFDRDYLHREMSRLLAEPSPRLPDRLDLAQRPAANWLQLVRSLSTQSVTDQHPLVRDQLCSAITTAFVLAAVPDADAGRPPLRPRIVKRVLDEMHDDPGRPWTASDMAEVAGVSIRRLQEGFRDYVEASPRECLTDIRLARVRADLLRGADGLTVADVAMRWGLMHTGRFAAAYRRTYGESPSETLRGRHPIPQ